MDGMTPRGSERLAAFPRLPASRRAPGRGVASFVADIEEAFRRAAGRSAARARALGRPVLAWTAAPLPRELQVDPVAAFDRARAVAQERVLWRSAGEPFALVGIGAAWSVEAAGEGRFGQAAAAWQSLLQDAATSDEATGRAAPEEPIAGPVAFGAFAFGPESPTDRVWHGFPAGRLTLPRVAVVRRAEAARLIVAALIDPPRGPAGLPDHEVHASVTACVEAIAGGGEAADAADARPDAADLAVDEFPPRAAWCAAVSDTARAIREQAFRKAVLARSLRIRAARLDPIAAVRALDEAYPDCTLFAVAVGGRCFFGATPERLVRLANGTVRVTALAGSARRGATADEDARLGAALLAGAKDRTEHAIVVEFLRDALSAVCTVVSAPADPVVLKLRNVQHLATPITGVLRGRHTALDLVARLHPSPAVGGAPRAEALRWIRAREGWERGWYAGPIGWVDGTGGGEFAVAIRSALVTGAEARVFAGCGIVAASDPDREYAESCLKLQPVLSALARGR
jgi:isochorismate synthase